MRAGPEPPPPSTGALRASLRMHRPLTSVFGRRLLCFWGQFVGTYSVPAYAAYAGWRERKRPLRCGFATEARVGRSVAWACTGHAYAVALLSAPPGWWRRSSRCAVRTCRPCGRTSRRLRLVGARGRGRGAVPKRSQQRRDSRATCFTDAGAREPGFFFDKVRDGEWLDGSPFRISRHIAS